MTKATWRNLAAVSATILAALLSGCAPPQKPPASPSPPPAAQTPSTPESNPAPTQAPPAESRIGSDDFQPAFFDFDSYALRDDAKAALDRDAELLRDHTAIKITIEGHCDDRGSAKYNQALGERRAQAARHYLVAAGIAANRIHVVSYGKDRPFATGSDEASRQQNRRAHFAVR
jgi:peptidoglycan-associated lipoprotein